MNTKSKTESIRRKNRNIIRLNNMKSQEVLRPILFNMSMGNIIKETKTRPKVIYIGHRYVCAFADDFVILHEMKQN